MELLQCTQLQKTYGRGAAAVHALNGVDLTVEHGEFFAAHKLLAGAGILTVLQVGGDVDDLNGQSAAFAATPWKFCKGDACQIRFVAMQDPAGTCRIDSGND